MAYSMRTEMHNYLTPLQGRTMMNEGVRPDVINVRQAAQEWRDFS